MFASSTPPTRGQFTLKRVLRWILVPVVSFATLYIAVILSLFLLIFGPYPKSLSEQTAGFVVGISIVLAGSIVAPRFRLAIAAILTVVAWIAAFLLNMLAIWALVGAATGVAFITWWFSPRRTKRSVLYVATLATCVFVAFIVFVYIRYVDAAPQPDPLPFELSMALDQDAPHIKVFYRYDLGGFIDHEWLWRIEAPPEIIAKIVTGLNLRPTDKVPNDFWHMPPNYWPRSLPKEAETFQTPSFPAENRGPDGAFFFLLHDKNRQTAYVWFKDNF